MLFKTSSRIGKSVIEINLDLLDTVPQSGNYFTGHLTGENYARAGFDAAF